MIWSRQLWQGATTSSASVALQIAPFTRNAAIARLDTDGANDAGLPGVAAQGIVAREARAAETLLDRLRDFSLVEIANHREQRVVRGIEGPVVALHVIERHRLVPVQLLLHRV